MRSLLLVAPAGTLARRDGARPEAVHLLQRAAVPRELPAGSASSAPGEVLPALLKPTEKRVLGLIADWECAGSCRAVACVQLSEG